MEIRTRPTVEGLSLRYERDAETGWEQIFVSMATSLDTDDALDLEEEVVNSIADEDWDRFSSVAFVAV